MKPAVLRPKALQDQQSDIRYYRKEAGARMALKVAKATHEALDQLELEPGIGSPRFAMTNSPGRPGIAWLPPASMLPSSVRA